MDDFLDFLEGLVLEHLLQQTLDLASAEGGGQAQYLQGPPLLDELALDAQSFLGYLLPAVVADLFVPRLLPPLLQVPFHLQSPHRLQFSLLPHQHKPADVLEGDLLFH